jgi:hypothetical protein
MSKTSSAARAPRGLSGRFGFGRWPLTRARGPLSWPLDTWRAASIIDHPAPRGVCGRLDALRQRWRNRHAAHKGQRLRAGPGSWCSGDRPHRSGHWRLDRTPLAAPHQGGSGPAGGGVPTASDRLRVTAATEKPGVRKAGWDRYNPVLRPKEKP